MCNAEQQKTKSFMTPMVPAVVSVAFEVLMLLHLFVVYDPWGKPGGGAPLKTNSGKVVVEVFGNFENKKKEVKEKHKK